jgi:hypothetical protein
MILQKKRFHEIYLFCEVSLKCFCKFLRIIFWLNLTDFFRKKIFNVPQYDLYCMYTKFYEIPNNFQKFPHPLIPDLNPHSDFWLKKRNAYPQHCWIISPNAIISSTCPQSVPLDLASFHTLFNFFTPSVLSNKDSFKHTKIIANYAASSCCKRRQLY